MEAVLPDGHSQCILSSAHTHTLCHIILCQPTSSTHFLLLTAYLPTTTQTLHLNLTTTRDPNNTYLYFTLTYTLQIPFTNTPNKYLLQIHLTDTSYNEIVEVEAAERIPELRLSFDFFTVRKTVAYGPFLKGQHIREKVQRPHNPEINSRPASALRSPRRAWEKFRERLPLYLEGFCLSVLPRRVRHTYPLP